MPDWVKEILSTVWGWDLSDWDNDEDCDPDGGGDPPSGNATTWQFAYDNISQLVGVNLNQNPYATYTIDPAGNLTSVTVEGATTTFGHNMLNSMLEDYLAQAEAL